MDFEQINIALKNATLAFNNFTKVVNNCMSKIKINEDKIIYKIDLTADNAIFYATNTLVYTMHINIAEKSKLTKIKQKLSSFNTITLDEINNTLGYNKIFQNKNYV